MRLNTTLISWLVFASVPALIAAVVFARRERPLSWSAVNAQIDREFPAVASVTTAELAAELADAQRAPPRLLDARAQEEFAVSHLPGARHAATVEDAVRVLAAESGDREVVVYCSVGWRSAALAERLRAVRPGRVRNLRGSIFQWANEGRALESAAGAVSRVHPYDARWGALLDRARWAETSAPLAP